MASPAAVKSDIIVRSYKDALAALRECGADIADVVVLVREIANSAQKYDSDTLNAIGAIQKLQLEHNVPFEMISDLTSAITGIVEHEPRHIGFLQLEIVWCFITASTPMHPATNLQHKSTEYIASDIRRSIVSLLEFKGYETIAQKFWKESNAFSCNDAVLFIAGQYLKIERA